MVVDAEGSDAAILRSLIHYCEVETTCWPWVIQFESMGHCDRVEGGPVEYQVVNQLVVCGGYQLISYSRWNTWLVHGTALDYPKIKQWASTFACCQCERVNSYPYATDASGGLWCARCWNEPPMFVTHRSHPPVVL